jgi:D-alanyl-D-alanine carboxypeptidase (penicillin-binding protein 5/6)
MKTRNLLGRKAVIVLSSIIILCLSSAICTTSVMAGQRRKAKPVKSKVVTREADVCRSEVLMEAQSGTVLFEKDSHTPYPPASMVKMMTALLSMKMVKEGKASLDDMVTVSAWASKIGGSQIYLRQGETFRLEDLLKAIMIHSANDASVAVAEHISGSVEGFVDLMNMEAQELDMKHTAFHSVHGLPPGPGQLEDMASAYDLALLGRAIVLNYPKLLEYSSTEQASIRDGTFIMNNINKMLGKFKGLDGIKTGYYDRAGFCITSTAKQGDTRYIAVVMGCRNKTVRSNEAARLLNMGFNMFEYRKLATKNGAYSRAMPVISGTKQEVKLVFADDCTALLKRSDVNKVQVQEQFPLQQLKAPVKAGVSVGRLTFNLGDKELGSTEVLTGENIEKKGLLKRLGL